MIGLTLMPNSRIYLAGPMSGYEGLNFPAFHSAAARLRAQGHEVVNPAEINPDLNADWAYCMKEDIKALVDCDAIYMLDGWENSKGAKIEHFVAQSLGLKLVYEDYAKSQYYYDSNRNKPLETA